MKSILSQSIDKVDIQVLELLIQNHDNNKISSTLKIPLSTIQRRVKKLIEKEFVKNKNHIDYTKLGFKSGTIHVFLNDGNMEAILDKVSKHKGVTSLEVHIGNSDIIVGVVYKHGFGLLDIITSIKKMEGVERIVWSERIFEYPVVNNNISLLELE